MKLFFPVFILLITVHLSSFSQSFIKNKTGRALTFKEMQQQFAEFKSNNDLKQLKGWKVFKRYENEMQRMTDASGEPAGFETYLEEVVRVSEEKNSAQKASSIWSPKGTNNVPQNLTGYAENGIGRVNCVAFHPTNTSVFYVGVAQGGVWKTTNGGASYTPLTDNLPITRVSDICLDPTNPNTIYISLCDFEYIGKGLYYDGKKRNTHFGLGVYKSTDAGSTWAPTGLAFQLTQHDASLIRKILVNPSNANEVLACGVNGMYKSINGGSTFTRKLDSLFWDMVQDPVNTNVIYASTGWVKNSNAGSAAIYKSTDFGNTWAMLNTGIPFQNSIQRIKLAIAPTDPNFIYALAVDNSDGLDGVYLSTNAGLSWTYKFPGLNILEWGNGNASGGQGTYDLALLVDASNKNKIYAGGINLWVSADAATSFSPASHWTYQYGTNTIHADVHFMDRQPVSGDIFVCCDGGIYKTPQIQSGSWTSTWTAQWTNLSNGMQCSSFYRISSSANNVGRLIGGAQDNGSFYYDGTQWSTIFGGDGMDNYLDPTNNQVVIGSSQYGNFYYSYDGGNTGTTMGTNPNNEQAEWTTPLVADYNHHGVLYVANENVVKSTDGGSTWNPLSTVYSNSMAMQNTEASALAVANSNSNVIYFARRVRYEIPQNGVVFRSVNGGNSFTNITSNLPDTLYYTSLAINPNNSDEACITLAGLVAGVKIYKTTNGGASWANISYNLPNAPLNGVKYLPNTQNIMVAGDFGVYVLSGTNWVNYSSGLPNVIVSDIEFNTVLNKAYVATFGRGIWETNISSLINTGINQWQLSTLNFEVYPSFNSGEFTLKLNDEGGPVYCTITDVQGRRVFEDVLHQKENKIRIKVMPGCYFVKLEDKNLLGVKKIVVE